MNRKEQKVFNQKMVTLLNDIVYSLDWDTMKEDKRNAMLVAVTQLQGLLEE